MAAVGGATGGSITSSTRSTCSGLTPYSRVTWRPRRASFSVRIERRIVELGISRHDGIRQCNRLISGQPVPFRTSTSHLVTVVAAHLRPRLMARHLLRYCDDLLAVFRE